MTDKKPEDEEKKHGVERTHPEPPAKEPQRFDPVPPPPPPPPPPQNDEPIG